MPSRAALPIVLSLALLAGCATTPPAPVTLEGDAPMVDMAVMGLRDEQVLATDTFLAAHPDLRHRGEGIRAFRRGDRAEALRAFTRAARFADKPSQAMLGEMYWTGQGVDVDRALAYAWMDLAAERRYEGFLVLRERYWARMDAQEQARAVEVGQALYAEYGDEVARPRLARAIRRATATSMVSRPGLGGAAISVTVTGPGGEELVINDFFNRRYWDPTEYFRWQDQIWRAPVRRARVSVGELEALGAGAAEDAEAEAPDGAGSGSGEDPGEDPGQDPAQDPEG